MDSRQRHLVLLISIHALREESDQGVARTAITSAYFNPRSP